MDKFKSFLYDTLMLKAQEYENGVQDILNKPLVFAQIVKQADDWYLGRHPLSLNKEKIHTYSRQLIHQIMTTKDTIDIYNTIKQKKHNSFAPEWTKYTLKAGSSELIQAIIKNDYKTFKSLVSRGIDIHTRELHGYSPLMIALLCKSHPIYVSDLIDAGADIEDWHQGKNPLIMAIESANDLGAVMLLQRGANPHIEYQSENLISLATNRRCPRFVDMMIEKEGVDVNMKLISEQSIFHYTAKNGLINAMKKILQQGFPINSHNGSGVTALMDAAYTGETDAVRLLIKEGADVNATAVSLQTTPLIYAAEKGYNDVVQILIEAGANTNAKADWGFTPLLAASQYAHHEVVKTLLDAGSNALETCQADGAKTTALHLLSDDTVSKNNSIVETAKLLIDAGVDVNAQNEDKKTALMIASANGHTSLVEFLLQSGANINITDANEKTALIYAIEHGQLNITRLLLDKNQPSKKNLNSYLMIAAQASSLNVVKDIIKRGADVNTTDEHLNSPLSIALKHQHPMIIEALIDAGADVSRIVYSELTQSGKPFYQAFNELVKTNPYWNDKLVKRIATKINAQRKKVFPVQQPNPGR